MVFVRGQNDGKKKMCKQKCRAIIQTLNNTTDLHTRHKAHNFNPVTYTDTHRIFQI